MTEKPRRETNFCPVCGEKLAQDNVCASCGFVPEGPSVSPRTFRAAKTVVLALLAAALVTLVWHTVIPESPQKRDGSYEVLNFEGETVFVAEEDFADWKDTTRKILKLKDRIADYKSKKRMEFGNLDEERRLERLILNANNQLGILVDNVREMEKREP
ncbi:MAG: zinc ribbon domain-containing protein [Planctomycetota bacterium]|nr:zinc ribbon domain-containing protein [Planctomycetota bacterium]